MENILAQSEASKEFTRELCFEFTQEAASLWLLRSKAVCAPHYTLRDLLELDNRLEAQIDALRVAGEPGWEMCAEKPGHGKPESLFAPSILAFESRDEKRIAAILDAALKTPAVSEGIVSALGWMTCERAEPHIKTLLMSKSPIHQTIGIAASAFHRKDPGSYLENAFYSPDLTLKARSLRAVGELGGRGDQMMPGRLQEQLKTEDAACRFWAAWSAVLLGNTAALDYLKPFIPDARSPLQQEALQLVLRKVDLKDALIIHKQFAGKTDAQRMAIVSAGVIGDPALLPWLLNRMNIPALARLAGEAFTLITGVNISSQEMEGTWPAGFEAGPNDDPKDPNVALDPDENLPWPDAKKISAWWDKNKPKFNPGQRYLLGKPITQDHLQTVLQTGLQRQRAAAALELALLAPGRPLYNTCAPAWRQIPESKPQLCSDVPPNYGARQLAITAVNSITPLGHNAAMTAASVRAGIVRHRIHEGFLDGNDNPITAVAIKGVDDTKDNSIDRLKVISESCINDLLKNHFGNMVHHPANIYLLLGVASEERPGPDFGGECMDDLLKIMQNYTTHQDGNVMPQGYTSLHHAIAKAADIIDASPDTACIIGSIDSMHAESILNWLESAGRLKSSTYGRHQGLIPSEAVAFVVVEDLGHAKKMKRRILARITALGLADEPHPRLAGAFGTCSGLTDACKEALGALSEHSAKVVFNDLNGEQERALEWSIIESRCFNKGRIPRLWKSAFHLGDIGAASGGVMASVVVQGFERNWLASPVMISCSDDFGTCGVVVLEKEESEFQGASPPL